LGYAVEILGKPYDLRSTRDGSTLYVEVKGTTTSGETIILTPNEIEFARSHASSMALFIVSEVNITEGHEPVASGGKSFELRPWNVDRTKLKAMCYSYCVPIQDR
ncbi:MAG TPA: DUF3883 domain-containing protein, partial [Chthoniobacterales bacterium]|nr:DUF3883 domain-containing protein [Chthoniobacterales bacterium]